MKKQIIILALAASVFPAVAQTTNSVAEDVHPQEGRPERKAEFQSMRAGEGGERKRGERREMTEKEKDERDERRLQLMEKTLEEIGVTEEQRGQIKVMQKAFKAEMRASSKQVDAAKKKLHELEDSFTATEDEIYAAIDEISSAQSAQLKILAKNRMQMERLLGKDKFKQFMEAARKQYKKHGRRGGAGIPKPDEKPGPGE